LTGGWPADRFGRKPTLLWIGVLYIGSAVGSALAWNVEAFIVARFIGGIGIGVSTVVAPLYIAEIAPPAHRGRLAGMFQFNIVFGIVVAFLSNALLAGIGVMGRAPYKQVITHGFVLDENGKEYSKSAIEKAKAEGKVEGPRLAGQHSQYFFSQMMSYRLSLRDAAAMHEIAVALKPSDIEDLAAYIGSR